MFYFTYRTATRVFGDAYGDNEIMRLLESANVTILRATELAI